MTLQRELGLPFPIEDPAHEAVMNIVLTGEMLAKEGQRIFRPLGLTDSQFNVLIILKYQTDDEGITQTELGQRLLVNRSNVTGLIDRMEQAGWVSRKDMAGDRRVNKVLLTREGRSLLDKAEAVYYKRIQAVMGKLPAKDIKSICTILERLRRNLAEEE